MKRCSTRGQPEAADEQSQSRRWNLGFIKTGEERRGLVGGCGGGGGGARLPPFSKGAANEHISVANGSKVTRLAGRKGTNHVT